jgi:hypothetical protein
VGPHAVRSLQGRHRRCSRRHARCHRRFFPAAADSSYSATSSNSVQRQLPPLDNAVRAAAHTTRLAGRVRGLVFADAHRPDRVDVPLSHSHTLTGADRP